MERLVPAATNSYSVTTPSSPNTSLIEHNSLVITFLPPSAGGKPSDGRCRPKKKTATNP
ncbi:hypothetical protein K439DRAFT_1626185 [Ramaria rubella]|nr:hypothetical protein K439DRAFT_1626185 [Ramaria rubella]